MIAARAETTVRLGLHGSLLLVAAALLLTFGPGRALAADPGVVEVYGYQWSQPYQVKLDTLQGTPATIDGQQVNTYTLLDVLRSAEAQQSPAGKDFTVATLSKIEVTLPGNRGKVTYGGSQIRNQGGLATFFVDDRNVTVMRVPGRGPGGTAAQFEYDVLNPQLYQPKQSLGNFTVAISPSRKAVKSGTGLSFTATTKGLPQGAKPTFTWSINGATQSSRNSRFDHTFRGKSGRSFAVGLIVTAAGYNPATSGAQVFIDKVEKEKKEKTKRKEKQEDTGGNVDDWPDDSGYVPGYYDEGSDGTGNPGGPATGSPSTSAPDRKKEKQEPPQPEDTGQTVTGELIDPAAIATISPPAESPASGTQEAAPAEEPQGGGTGIPKGVSAALGIGALLGLGGLAEAGAFTGFFRRLRLRP